jgi:uncharacterized membrane protein
MAATITVLLWFSAIGCGLIAGLYFAFSTFIMRALGRIDPAQGVAAMNAINVDIVRSLFLPLFLATTLAGLILAGIGIVRPGTPGAWPMIVGGMLYFAGMFVVTMLFNVPLNNALAADGGGQQLWTDYLQRWTSWNHLRTFASTAACASFVLALTQR